MNADSKKYETFRECIFLSRFISQYKYLILF